MSKFEKALKREGKDDVSLNNIYIREKEEAKTVTSKRVITALAIASVLTAVYSCSKLDEQQRKEEREEAITKNNTSQKQKLEGAIAEDIYQHIPPLTNAINELSNKLEENPTPEEIASFSKVRGHYLINETPQPFTPDKTSYNTLDILIPDGQSTTTEEPYECQQSPCPTVRPSSGINMVPVNVISFEKNDESNGRTSLQISEEGDKIFFGHGEITDTKIYCLPGDDIPYCDSIMYMLETAKNEKGQITGYTVTPVINHVDRFGDTASATIKIEPAVERKTGPEAEQKLLEQLNRLTANWKKL